MPLFKMFTHKKERDLFQTCYYLLRNLKVNFTDRGLSETLQNHVDYPSLLSLKDTLFEYGVEIRCHKKGAHSYDDFETPFIYSIQQEDWHRLNGTIVTSTASGSIEYLDPLTDKLNRISVEEIGRAHV